jgi:hypothetical protein
MDLDTEEQFQHIRNYSDYTFRVLGKIVSPFGKNAASPATATVASLVYGYWASVGARIVAIELTCIKEASGSKPKRSRILLFDLISVSTSDASGAWLSL